MSGLALPEDLKDFLSAGRDLQFDQSQMVKPWKRYARYTEDSGA